MILTIIIGIIALSVIILVHELGHFITAKLSGVRVEEFGIGMPPRIFSIKRGETRYSINWIPFGGFNKMTGEIDPTQPRSLASKSTGTRLLVLAAGSLMLFVLSLVLFSIVFMIPRGSSAFTLPGDVVTGQITVRNIAADSPAEKAGINAGDVILSIAGQPVTSFYEMQSYIKLNLDKETTILIRHSDSTTEQIQAVPRSQPPAGQGALGVQIEMVNPTIISKPYPLWQVIPMGANRFYTFLVLYKDGLVAIFTRQEPASFIGPIGIISITSQAAKTGIHTLLDLSAVLSLIIGICNLFPLPALDGGRIVFVILEWVRRGRRVSTRIEGVVHSVGFIVLIAFMLAITYQDIVRIVTGESLVK